MKDRCVLCFKIISVPTRFKIFNYLKNAKKKVNISSLVKLTSLRQPTVSFHVKQLASLGIVKTKKEGREVLCETHQKCCHCPLFV